MVRILLSYDMYKVLARYTIFGHDCVNACLPIVYVALAVIQVLYARCRALFFQCQYAIVSHICDRYSHRSTMASNKRHVRYTNEWPESLV